MRRDKRLSLHKDTLKSLNASELDQVGGGMVLTITSTLRTITTLTQTWPRFSYKGLSCTIL